MKIVRKGPDRHFEQNTLGNRFQALCSAKWDMKTENAFWCFAVMATYALYEKTTPILHQKSIPVLHNSFMGKQLQVSQNLSVE